MEAPTIVEPQATRKRQREEVTGPPGGWGSSSLQPLTLALLQQALQENRNEITTSFRESMQGNRNRVQVEANVENHVNRTTELLQAMTDTLCHGTLSSQDR